MPHEITVKLDTYGTEQYKGHRVRKVSDRAVPYFERIGWTVARSAGVYGYIRMYPPEGGDTKHPAITLTVPTDEEILSLARQAHAARQPLASDLYGWKVKYTPRRVDRVQQQVYTVYGDTGGAQVESYESVSPAEFSVGTTGDPWHAYVIWDNGDDAPPRFGAR